jgi:uncharacterized protein YjiS (DUF1127 family)
MLLYRHRILPYIDVTGRLRALTARIADIRQAVEGRRAISLMDARMLSDIGLSRSEALQEINRRPWDTTPRNRH